MMNRPTEILTALEPETGGEPTAPERFDPSTMRGGSIEAEHMARYRFAAQLVHGCEVLDAACGWGYGSNLLAASGAASVLGVDSAEHVIDAAAAVAGDRVSFEHGDIEQLNFADDSFDAVVCFEAIEHVSDWSTALNELARVLRDDGFLVISSPNDPAYGNRNEHHVHQFDRDGFASALGERFRHVELFCQSPWITSLISSYSVSEGADVEVPVGDLLKLVAAEPQGEIYEVAIASNVPLPEAKPQAVCATQVEFKEWIERFEAQDARLLELQQQLGAHQTQEANSLRAEVLRLGKLLGAQDREILDAERVRYEADARIRAMQQSTSWRITAPLRENRLLRRLTGRA